MTNKDKMVGCRITNNMYKQLESMDGSISKNIFKAIEIYLMRDKKENSKVLVELALKENRLNKIDDERFKLASEIKMIRQENNLEPNENITQSLKKSYYLNKEQEFLNNELDRINNRKISIDQLNKEKNQKTEDRNFIMSLEYHLKSFNEDNNTKLTYDDFISKIGQLKHEKETGETEQQLKEHKKHLERLN